MSKKKSPSKKWTKINLEFLPDVEEDTPGIAQPFLPPPLEVTTYLTWNPQRQCYELRAPNLRFDLSTKPS